MLSRLPQKIWAKKTALLWLGVLFVVVLICYQLNQKVSEVNADTRGLDGKQAQALMQVLQGKQLRFFTGDLGEVAQSVQQLSWVSSVTVVRDWHKGVMVSVVPRQAVARFGSAHLVDAKGVVFVPADPAALTDHRLASLYGDVDDTKILMQKLHQLNLWFSPVGLWVKDVIATPRDTWIVRFGSGLRVVVDFENLDEKLFGFSRILSTQKLSVDDIEAVDLRYKNGFSMTPKRIIAQANVGSNASVVGATQMP